MTDLSIVIPKSNDTDQFETTLASVLANRPASCEVNVVCPGGYEDPYDLGAEVSFLDVDRSCSLLESIQHGFRASQSKVVHLLLCGTEVHEGWCEPALTHFQSMDVATVAPVVLRPDLATIESAGAVLSSLGKLSSRGRGLKLSAKRNKLVRPATPTLTAGFYRRSVFLDPAELNPWLGPELAFVDLARCLHANGFETLVEPDSLVVQVSGTEASESAFQAARRHEHLFWKHYGSGLSLGLHPLLVAGELVAQVFGGRPISTLCGRGFGCLAAPFQRALRPALRPEDLAEDEAAETVAQPSLRSAA